METGSLLYQREMGGLDGGRSAAGITQLVAGDSAVGPLRVLLPELFSVLLHQCCLGGKVSGSKPIPGFYRVVGVKSLKFRVHPLCGEVGVV